MKTCKKCKVEQPHTAFHANKTYTDGYTKTCKICVKQKYADNIEEGRAKSRANYHNNATKRKAQSTAWKERNTLAVAANDGRSRALRCGAILPDAFDLNSTVPFYEKARRLTEETGVPHEVDHIIPCSQGGLHCPTNLQVLTATANNAKRCS